MLAGTVPHRAFPAHHTSVIKGHSEAQVGHLGSKLNWQSLHGTFMEKHTKCMLLDDGQTFEVCWKWQNHRG